MGAGLRWSKGRRGREHFKIVDIRGLVVMSLHAQALAIIKVTSLVLNFTSFSASRRSSRLLRFSQCGMASTLSFATSGRAPKPPYSRARCCSSVSMKV